ncbi:hypothetical protein HUT18_20940 [Streptomyces sp. NA04227]|uniref:hypothetical protein n=1 Tax=Streptomyces sp. NA04227 TaxID=2742136 RepID=UPI001590DDAA|nr:hypothetical protein [Streptomyces sp. NA04227]QKW08466.1 hypothetical protein HUT18_20940 [Streptomyces sp. NA04227]
MSGNTDAVGELPVSRAVLISDSRVAAEVARIGERCGVDFTDDEATRAHLARRRAAVRSKERGWFMWTAGLTTIAGVLLLAGLPMAKPLEEGAPKSDFVPLVAPGAALTVLGIALIVTARGLWRRELRDPVLVGYREVLAVARAHGLPVSTVPDWLVGRTSQDRTEIAPVPTLPDVRPLSADAAASAPQSGSAAAAPPVSVPEKSSAVREYEQTADSGGWQGQLGCLVLLSAILPAVWASSEGEPVGYAGSAALLVIAAVIAVVADRANSAKQELREAALSYARAVSAAQQAGVRVPQLSPELQKLLDEDEAEKRR